MNPVASGPQAAGGLMSPQMAEVDQSWLFTFSRTKLTSCQDLAKIQIQIQKSCPNTNSNTNTLPKYQDQKQIHKCSRGNVKKGGLKIWIIVNLPQIVSSNIFSTLFRWVSQGCENGQTISDFKGRLWQRWWWANFSEELWILN